MRKQDYLNSNMFKHGKSIRRKDGFIVVKYKDKNEECILEIPDTFENFQVINNWKGKMSDLMKKIEEEVNHD